MEEFHKIVSLVGNNLHKIWNYGLITIAGNSVTIGNILIAVILLFIGARYFKYFSTIVKNYIKHKLDTDRDAANALEKLVLYSCFTLYVIIVLEIANIPLSIFAFIGGALAIGIGLGAQNLIGNFICSLLVMIERPLKIGDVVELEGVLGTVHSIGARCAVITTTTGVELLVPNNKIIYNNVVNWTYNDSLVQYQALLKIPRKAYIKYEAVEQLTNDIKKTLDHLDFISKQSDNNVNLIKIEESLLSFVIQFYFDAHRIEKIDSIKNSLNLALIKNLADDNFTVEYLKTVDLKAPAPAAS
jgi:potassium-dependent mechanosensitive channel